MLKAKYLKFLLSVILIHIAKFTFSQKQNNTWYFGANGAGLLFNNCNTNVLTNGVNNGIPFEGQSSISDALTGDLLFYTDGYNIYDSTNSIMLNGTEAGLSNSCTQTIIIKRPGSNNIYYMFNPDVQGGLVLNTLFPNAFGINYAIVNMSMNSGKGAVTSRFNSLKDTSNCEMLTAVYHANGHDIWLIGHEYKTNNYFTFLITNSGINSTPVISSVGPIINTYQGGTIGASNLDAIGELRASPNGNKLAYTTYYNGFTCLADFDRATGMVSNAISLTLNGGGYGVSFSPDNFKLYVTGVDITTAVPDFPTNGKIFQFDISSGNPTTIQNSRTIIFTDTNGGFRSIKSGLDKKLYVARINSSGNGTIYLGLINNPDNIGAACNYVHNGVYLNGKQCGWGLNNCMEDSTSCITMNIHEIESRTDTRIFPNPFSNELKFDLRELNTVNFMLYDATGKAVINQRLEHNANLNTNSLAEGIYFYTLMNEKVIISKGKIVKR